MTDCIVTNTPDKRSVFCFGLFQASAPFESHSLVRPYYTRITFPSETNRKPGKSVINVDADFVHFFVCL